MGVDVHAAAFALLEQFFEVLQVVAGNGDRLAADGRDADLRRLGMAVGAGVGLVQQGHDLQVQLARRERPAEEFVGRVAVSREEVEGFVEGGVNGRVFAAQHAGVLGIGGRALQAVDDQFRQSGDVGAQEGLPLQDRDLAALADKTIEVGRRRPGSGPRERFHRLTRVATGRFIDRAGPCRAWRRPLASGLRGGADRNRRSSPWRRGS